MCVEYDAHKVTDNLTEYPIDYPDADRADLDIPENYAVRPTNLAPVVWYDPDRNTNRLSLFEFGLVPSWTKGEDQAKSGRYKYANARDDRLLESPMWEPLFESKRCLVPANGFFEPHKYHQKVRVPGGPKPTDSIPFYFKLKSSNHFAFAGLYDEWTNLKTGEIVKSFSIITTDPNKQMEKVHNKNPRQPVILNKENYTFWIDPKVRPKDYLDQNIFTPWPDEDMEYYQVSKQLHYDGTGEELINPVDNPVNLEPPVEQGNLFG